MNADCNLQPPSRWIECTRFTSRSCPPPIAVDILNTNTGHDYFDPQTMLCAGYDHGGSDACSVCSHLRCVKEI